MIVSTNYISLLKEVNSFSEEERMLILLVFGYKVVKGAIHKELPPVSSEIERVFSQLARLKKSEKKNLVSILSMSLSEKMISPKDQKLVKRAKKYLKDSSLGLTTKILLSCFILKRERGMSVFSNAEVSLKLTRMNISYTNLNTSVKQMFKPKNKDPLIVPIDSNDEFVERNSFSLTASGEYAIEEVLDH